MQPLGERCVDDHLPNLGAGSGQGINIVDVQAFQGVSDSLA